MNSRRHAAFWVALAGELVLLVLLTRFGDLAAPGHPLRFVTIFLAAGGAYLAAVTAFGAIDRRLRPRVFWAAAIAFRLAIFPMPPGDDLWRYLWEGKVQAQGFNPYLLGPGAEELALLRDDDVWPKINNSEWPAIYPPAAELAFARLARISQSPLFFKAVFALADLLVVFFLLRTHTGPTRHRNTAWYAWNPLVITAFAGGGHFDSLMLAALAAAVWALRRANPRPFDNAQPAWTWATLSALCLGVAIALKVVPVFLLPVWCLALRKRSFLLLLSVAVPWLLARPYGGPSVVTATLAEYSRVTRFNDLGWWIFELPFWPSWLTAAIDAGWAALLPYVRLSLWYENSRMAVLLALTMLFVTWRFRDDWPRAALWVLGAVLLLSPTVHPWYVTWILPLACWRRQFAWFILSLSITIALLVWEAGPCWAEWEMNPVLHLLVTVPPLFAYAILRYRRHAKGDHPEP